MSFPLASSPEMCCILKPIYFGVESKSIADLFNNFIQKKIVNSQSSETVPDDIQSEIRAKYNYKITVKG